MGKCAGARRRLTPRFDGGSAHAALTLVELLVALTILVVVSASTLLIFRGISRAWKTGELRTERYQQARLLFELFERELSSCVASSRYPLIGTTRSDEKRLEADSVADELFFVGTLPGRAGFIERGYWLNAAHEFMCHDDDVADADYATGTSEPCGKNITEFTVAYFDGNEWIQQWDGRSQGAQAGLVPKAVHIIMSIGDPKPERFETIITIPTS